MQWEGALAQFYTQGSVHVHGVFTLHILFISISLHNTL